MNTDFTINYVDVVPFDLSSNVCPPSPGAPRPPSPPAPRPSPPASPHPPTPSTHPVSPSVSVGHVSTLTSLPPDTDRPGTPSEDTDVGSCSSQSSPDDDSPCDSPSVSPSASPPITLSEEEEEEKKKEDPSYGLRSGRGRSRTRGPGAHGPGARGGGRGSGAICHHPLDDISVMEEERLSKHGRCVRARGGVTSPRTLRRKR